MSGIATEDKQDAGNTSLASIDTKLGTVAAGSADSGNPIKVGGKYNSSPPTLSNGQRGDLQLDATGNVRVTTTELAGVYVGGPSDGSSNAQVNLVTRTFNLVFNGSTWDRAPGDTNGAVVQPALSANFWRYAAAASGIVSSTTAVTIKTAAGGSIRNYLSMLEIDHDALGGATEIAVRDGAAGTVLWRGRLQTAAKEGTAISFNPPLKGTANTLMEVVTLTSVSGGVYVNAQGFTGN